jgi:hypothetical protein
MKIKGMDLTSLNQLKHKENNTRTKKTGNGGTSVDMKFW